MGTREEKFLWGVATSAYQSEGGCNGPGQPRTNWADAEEKGTVQKLGNAAEFLLHYEADFDRCVAMGCNAFRLGLEWSRVQPSSSKKAEPAPAFDEEALRLYARVLAAARKRGIEPVLTLHHFVHPAWFGPDLWLSPEGVDAFALYVEKSVTTINRLLVNEHGVDPVRRYITINEPNMLTLNTYFGTQFPGGGKGGIGVSTTCYNYLFCGHIRAYNLIHDLFDREGWGDADVTFNNYCSDLYWADKLFLDLITHREKGVPRRHLRDFILAKADEMNAAFREADLPLLHDVPWFFGAALKKVLSLVGRGFFNVENFAPMLDELEKSPRPSVLDSIGLDYYDPFVAHGLRLPVFWDHEFRSKSGREWLINSITSKWWDWRVLPRGLGFFCDYYSRDLGGKSLLVAENGMAQRRRPGREKEDRGHRRDETTRSQFLELHVAEVRRIIAAGIPLQGYLHWSLFDNYEWGSYTPRFGLFSLNYHEGSERQVEAPDGDRPSETYARLIAAARRGEKPPA